MEDKFKLHTIPSINRIRELSNFDIFDSTFNVFKGDIDSNPSLFENLDSEAYGSSLYEHNLTKSSGFNFLLVRYLDYKADFLLNHALARTLKKTFIDPEEKELVIELKEALIDGDIRDLSIIYANKRKTGFSYFLGDEHNLVYFDHYKKKFDKISEHDIPIN